MSELIREKLGRNYDAFVFTANVLGDQTASELFMVEPTSEPAQLAGSALPTSSDETLVSSANDKEIK